MSDQTQRQAIANYVHAVQEHMKAASDHRQRCTEVIDNLAGSEIKQAALDAIDALQNHCGLSVEPQHKQAYAENLQNDPRRALAQIKTLAKQLGEARTKVANADIGHEIEVEDYEDPRHIWTSGMAETTLIGEYGTDI